MSQWLTDIGSFAQAAFREQLGRHVGNSAICLSSYGPLPYVNPAQPKIGNLQQEISHYMTYPMKELITGLSILTFFFSRHFKRWRYLPSDCLHLHLSYEGKS